MKSKSIIILVAGASLTTLALSVFISFCIGISSTKLANIIKKDPYTFMEAVKESGQAYQKVAQQKALEGEDKRIEEELKNPKKIDLKNRVTFGPKKAPITIVEFGDFQCPYCAKTNTKLKSLIKKYEGKVNVVYKHFPLSFHPFAEPAAHYFEAIAIVDHAKARQFHDLIFATFSKYARAKNSAEITKDLNALARKVGVSASQIQKNMAQAKKNVKRDLKEAEALKVRGTPSFFVNGVNPGRKDLEDVIEIILKKL